MNALAEHKRESDIFCEYHCRCADDPSISLNHNGDWRSILVPYRGCLPWSLSSHKVSVDNPNIYAAYSSPTDLFCRFRRNMETITWKRQHTRRQIDLSDLFDVQPGHSVRRISDWMDWWKSQ